MSGLFAPLVSLEPIDRDELNRWLVAWGHKMGPYSRPSYAIEAHHALLHNGDTYRFDGWILLGKGGGGGRDSRTGRPGRKMKIWGWAATAEGRAQLRDRVEQDRRIAA